MSGFQHYLAQLLIRNTCLDRLKVKVTLEDQKIKWSLSLDNLSSISQLHHYQDSSNRAPDKRWGGGGVLRIIQR